MSAIIGYTRVSTSEQTTDAQSHQISGTYNVSHWFSDEATSGAVKALERPGFADLFKFARKGDTIVVQAIDRLGRDTVDVLNTVEALKAKGVAIVSMREGFDMSTDMGEAMLTMLAALGKLERSNIKKRQLAGIEKAKAEGRALGRAKEINDSEVKEWRVENQASIKATAEHFGISTASVKRAMKAVA